MDKEALIFKGFLFVFPPTLNLFLKIFNVDRF